MAWFGTANKKTTSTTGHTGPPLAPVSLLGTLTPPDATAERSIATTAALAAAAKQRKKAAGGQSLATATPDGPATNTPATLAPKSLIGS